MNKAPRAEKKKAQPVVHSCFVESTEFDLIKRPVIKKKSSTPDAVIKGTTSITPDKKVEVPLGYLLTASEYEYYKSIADLAGTDLRIVLNNNNEPHTLETLSEVLSLPLKKTKEVVRRFEKKGLVGVVTHGKFGYISQSVMLFPNSLSRAVQKACKQ